MIGKGQFGQIFKGFNKKDPSKVVAIKEVMAANQRQALKLAKEVHILCDLSHINIVKVLFFIQNRKYSKFFIIMSYVNGPSLFKILQKNGKLSEQITFNYIKQILNGLEYIHTKHVIHRDLKSQNILISNFNNYSKSEKSEEILKIVDFGSATYAPTHNQNKEFVDVTATAAHSITPLWTAPEAITQALYTRKMDVWSLGCTLIECVTAQLPWHECNFQTPFAALFQIAESNVLPAWPTSLSYECQDFLKCCLRRDVKARYSSKELKSHDFLYKKYIH